MAVVLLLLCVYSIVLCRFNTFVQPELQVLTCRFAVATLLPYSEHGLHSNYEVFRLETRDCVVQYVFRCDVTGLQCCQPSSTTSHVFITPSVVPTTDRRLLYPACMPLIRPSAARCKQSFLLSWLLIIGNVERNPGPCSTSMLNSSQCSFGLMNARSAVKKAALIHDVIADYRLDLTAITETWIPSDAPNAVSLDIAPS